MRSQPKAVKISKRRRRASLQHIVIWTIIVLFSLSIVGGIIVIGASVGR
ncbi:MAG: hypothetical protein KGM44_05265 [bacterium]|nr:hypothetical protein [bacterium]